VGFSIYNYNKSIDRYNYRQIYISNSFFPLKNILAQSQASSNQLNDQVRSLQRSVQIIIEIRSRLPKEDRSAVLRINQPITSNLTEILIQQNQLEEAFKWINLATTTDLADYNRLINAQVANPEAQKAIENWQTNNQQLEAMRQQLQEKFTDESARKMREFEEKVNKEAETIAQKYPEVAELFETKPTDIAQLRQNIAPDTLVIQPVPLRDKIALFLLTKDKLTVIESKTKADEFNQLVNKYRNQLADRKNADYIYTSSQLYDILIRPIEQEIKTNSPKNLAIIATDQLRYIPFESLYDSKTEKYLLQKYPISYLTRISTANIPNSPAKTTKNLQALALANPKPTNQELKGTEKEAENLLKIFPQSETYLGEKATLDTFKTQASRFSILHLGTHGCFELAGCPNLKMQANTILFANNQQYNIADAALLGLKNTELITLSACQTAKEANANGQEISGLAYVLERAGAKSSIASLWNAEDNTSAEIMTEFYQNLQKGMTKSEAMQKAKLSQIETNPHPFFWSPFILIGDAQ
jgi:CHAT domain-containing protein